MLGDTGHLVAAIDRRTGLEVLDRGECLALLRVRTLGRISVVVDVQPLVFLVNFALDGEAIVFRTEPSTARFTAITQMRLITEPQAKSSRLLGRPSDRATHGRVRMRRDR